MSCRNDKCERTCPEGGLFCCAPCALDSAGTKKLGHDRRMSKGTFHTHACNEREQERQIRLEQRGLDIALSLHMGAGVVLDVGPGPRGFEHVTPITAERAAELLRPRADG